MKIPFHPRQQHELFLITAEANLNSPLFKVQPDRLSRLRPVSSPPLVLALLLVHLESPLSLPRKRGSLIGAN
jgi:hypothetical protein